MPSDFITNDFLSHDNRETLTHIPIRRVNGVTERKRITLENCTRGDVTSREAFASGGAYTSSDVVFFLPVDETIVSTVTTSPKAGDLLEDAAEETHTVLEARLEDFGSSWICISRNMAIVHNLRDTVEWMRCTNSQDRAGGRKPTWERRQTLKGRLQETAALAGEDLGQLDIQQTWDVFLEEEIDVAIDDLLRIGGEDYEVSGWRNRERIDELMVVTVT